MTRKAHGDAVVEMRRSTVAAAEPLAARPAAHGRAELRLRCSRRRWPSSPAATAASRSDSLTRSSSSPCISVSPSAKLPRPPAPDTRRSSTGARSAGTVTPFSSEARTRRSATSSPPALRAFETSICAAHLLQRQQQPGAGRVHQHVLDGDVGARHDQRGDQRKAGRGRVAGHGDDLAGQLALAVDADMAHAVAVGLDRRDRRRSPSASSRCGRASSPARSPW